MNLSFQNRIILNILATYGYSLFALVCGVFSSRWLLMALGEVDLGLFGVIGGLVVFIKIINDILAAGVGRFYGVSIGLSKVSPKEGLIETQKWFNTAVTIHIVVPTILVLIFYPVGIYLINHILTIPENKVYSCIIVFRVTCISAFFSMASIPYYAMYKAKQYIAELTIVSVLETSFRISLMCYMVNHPGEWLTKYSILNSSFQIIPNLMIAFRARSIFPECRINISYLWDKDYLLKLFHFSGWQAFGFAGWFFENQGNAILINKFFGPAINASHSISHSLAGHTMTLAQSLSIAFSPAIHNSFGEGKLDRCRRLAFFTCKLGTILVLIFALPLILEMDKVLILWLKNPPQYVNILCKFVIISIIIDRLSNGHMIAINAFGKVGTCQCVLGCIRFINFPLTWLCFYIAGDVLFVGWVSIITMTLCSTGRIVFARYLVNMSVRKSFRIVLVLLGAAILALGCGYLVQSLIQPSFVRLFITGIIVNAILIPLCYYCVFDNNEKQLIESKIKNILLKHYKKRTNS